MSFRNCLPFVALLTLGLARPAFPCEGNPACPGHKDGAKAEGKAHECGGKGDHAKCDQAKCDHAKCDHAKGDVAKCDHAKCTHAKCDQAECAKKAEAAKAAPKAAPLTAAQLKGAKVFEMSVTEKGYEPATINVKKGVPVKLVITRKTDRTCAKQIVVKDYDIDTELPLNKAVEVAFIPKAAGNVRYACSMDHVAGVLVVQ